MRAVKQIRLSETDLDKPLYRIFPIWFFEMALVTNGGNLALLRLKFQVQHPRPAGHRMLRWTNDTSTLAARNVA